MTNLTKHEIQCLKDLREVCIDEDLLDLSFPGWEEKQKKVDNAWEALKIIASITHLTND